MMLLLPEEAPSRLKSSTPPLASPTKTPMEATVMTLIFLEFTESMVFQRSFFFERSGMHEQLVVARSMPTRRMDKVNLEQRRLPLRAIQLSSLVNQSYVGSEGSAKCRNTDIPIQE